MRIRTPPRVSLTGKNMKPMLRSVSFGVASWLVALGGLALSLGVAAERPNSTLRPLAAN